MPARLEEIAPVGHLPALRGIEEVERDDVDATLRDARGHVDHERVRLSGAGAVREDERRAEGIRRAIHERGGLAVGGDVEPEALAHLAPSVSPSERASRARQSASAHFDHAAFATAGVVPTTARNAFSPVGSAAKVSRQRW